VQLRVGMGCRHSNSLDGDGERGSRWQRGLSHCSCRRWLRHRLLGPPPKRRGRFIKSSGMIEMEIDGVSVRIGRGADARTVAAVIRRAEGPTT